MKKQAFPNEEFNSQNEYFDFAWKYQVWGGDAYSLKKKMDKQAKALEPTRKQIKENK